MSSFSIVIYVLTSLLKPLCSDVTMHKFSVFPTNSGEPFLTQYKFVGSELFIITNPYVPFKISIVDFIANSVSEVCV